MNSANFDILPLLRAILVRLVRIAIGCGISYQAFTKILRTVYFQVGSEFEPVKGKPNSDSRISLLTGLPRRDVRSLREQQAEEPQKVQPSLERQVMHAWSSDPELLDNAGNMRPVARTIRQGGMASFEAIVERVSKDIRARSLLDEWLRKGLVLLDEQDRVCITNQRPGFGMEGASGASLAIGELACDLLAGFEQTYLLSRPVPGYCYQVVYGHRLTEESVQLICSHVMREGYALGNRLNRLIVEREALDASKPEATRRVSFGYAAYQAPIVEHPGLLHTEPLPELQAGSR